MQVIDCVELAELGGILVLFLGLLDRGYGFGLFFLTCWQFEVLDGKRLLPLCFRNFTVCDLFVAAFDSFWFIEQVNFAIEKLAYFGPGLSQNHLCMTIRCSFECCLSAGVGHVLTYRVHVCWGMQHESFFLVHL